MKVINDNLDYTAMYKRKIAYLVSLIIQIKQYNNKKLERFINIREVEQLLDMPSIGDRRWEKEPSRIRDLFDRFLDVYIEIYEWVLNGLSKIKKL